VHIVQVLKFPQWSNWGFQCFRLWCCIAG